MTNLLSKPHIVALTLAAAAVLVIGALAARLQDPAPRLYCHVHTAHVVHCH